MAKVKLAHVPYESAGPALIAVLSGEVPELRTRLLRKESIPLAYVCGVLGIAVRKPA